MKLDNLIAKGKNNEVYKSGDLVVKVFNEGYSKTDVFTEALIATSIEDLELNTPKIEEVTKVDGKWAIAMECVEGKTLSALIEEDPENTEKYVEMMVDIQLDMFSKKCPSLRKLKEKLTTKINMAPIDDAKRYEQIAGQISQLVNTNEINFRLAGNLEYDLSVVQSTATPTFRAFKTDILMQFAQAGFIPPRFVFEFGDIPGADEILQRLDAMSQEAEGQQVGPGYQQAQTMMTSPTPEMAL